MESQALRSELITLPCVRSHTLVRTSCGAWRREDILAVGACGTQTCCALLYFDATKLEGIKLAAAELRLTLQNVLPRGRGMMLRITGPDGTAREVQCCGDGPLCTDVLNLVAGHTEGLLRIAVKPDWPCGVFALIEPCCTAPCIVVTPCKERSSVMRIEQHHFDIEFDQNGTTPDINTALARQCTFYITNTGDAAFTASMLTCAEAPQWICDCGLTIGAGKTCALIAKYYGALSRIGFCAEGTGKARVSFIGQFYA